MERKEGDEKKERETEREKTEGEKERSAGVSKREDQMEDGNKQRMHKNVSNGKRFCVFVCASH